MPTLDGTRLLASVFLCSQHMNTSSGPFVTRLLLLANNLNERINPISILIDGPEERFEDGL
jgi:hypothetical protein